MNILTTEDIDKIVKKHSLLPTSELSLSEKIIVALKAAGHPDNFAFEEDTNVYADDYEYDLGCIAGYRKAIQDAVRLVQEIAAKHDSGRD